ncbi:hypothetical protein V6N13_041202 [Hibiscus sabdariffa]
MNKFAPISAVKDKDKAQDVSLFPLYQKKEEIKEIHIKITKPLLVPLYFLLEAFGVCLFFSSIAMADEE